MANSISGLNFSGLGSGIDFGLITESIIAQGRRPITQLQTQKDLYNRRIDSLRKMNTALVTLKDAATALTDQTLGTGKIASSTDATVVTATATSTATNQTINISVTRLATSLAQATKSYATTVSPVLAEGATSATIELRTGGSSTATATITIDSSNNSLTGLRDAINTANAGITASIVDITGDGTGNQLVLNSTATGAAGRVELVETTSTGTVTGLTIRNLNPAGAFSDLDASFSVNGLAVTRSTNEVTNVVSGVTLSLKKAGSSASVTVSNNTGAITEKLTKLVDSYNVIQTAITGQYTVDSNGRPPGVLAGDPTLRAVQDQLREALNTESTDNGGDFENLAQIGIGRDDDGLLTIDSDVLDDALADSLEDVQALLAGLSSQYTGIANTIESSALSLSDSISGVVQLAIEGFNASIKAIDQSILAQEARLDALRETLTRQFAAADAAIGQLNGQGSLLSSIVRSLQSQSAAQK